MLRFRWRNKYRRTWQFCRVAKCRDKHSPASTSIGRIAIFLSSAPPICGPVIRSRRFRICSRYWRARLAMCGCRCWLVRCIWRRIAWTRRNNHSEARADLAGALANYEQALELKPDLFYTLLNAGRVCDKLNEQKKAGDFYAKAVALDAQSPEALNGLGLALAKQGHAAEAHERFEKAIALRRDYSEAINNLGVLFVQQGKVNDAISAFQYGIQVAPNEDILYLNLGRTYVQAGNVERARQVMQQLLDRKPDNATARRALEELNSR